MAILLKEGFAFQKPHQKQTPSAGANYHQQTTVPPVFRCNSRIAIEIAQLQRLNLGRAGQVGGARRPEAPNSKPLSPLGSVPRQRRHQRRPTAQAPHSARMRSQSGAA